jgi:hypothetical protein
LPIVTNANDSWQNQMFHGSTWTLVSPFRETFRFVQRVTVANRLALLVKIVSRFGWLAACLLSCGIGGFVAAIEPEVKYNLLELPSSRLALARLQTEARFFWEKRPLREGLREIERVHSITIWIDRRIDPQQTLTLSTPKAEESVTLLSRLRQVAALVGAEVGLIENVLYFGPRGKVAPLQRATVELHDAISKSTSADRATLREFSWPELSTPDELLRQLEATWGVRVQGQLPHDLLHAGAFLQPATLATQLSVVCGGFDDEVVLGANQTFQLKPLGPETRWRANYRQLDLHRSNNLRGEYPGSSLRIRGGLGLVAGVSDFHLALLAPPPVKPPAFNDSQPLGFTVENARLKDVLGKLSATLGLEVEWAEGCTPAQQEQLISFRVSDATLDELLREVSGVSSMTIVRDGKRIFIKP